MFEEQQDSVRIPFYSMVFGGDAPDFSCLSVLVFTAAASAAPSHVDANKMCLSV